MAKINNNDLRKSIHDKILANNLNNSNAISEADMYKLFKLDDEILRAIDSLENIPLFKYSILIALKIAYYQRVDEVLEILGLLKSIDIYQEYKMKYIYCLLNKPLVLQSGNFLESAKTIASCENEFVARNILTVLTSSFLIDAKKQYEASNIIKGAKEYYHADYAAKVLINKVALDNNLAIPGAQIIVEADNICACETIYNILTNLTIINNVEALKAADIVKSFSCSGAELAKKVFLNKELINTPYALQVAIFLNEENPYDIEGYAYNVFTNLYLFNLGIAFDIAKLVKYAKSSINARYICDLVFDFSFIPNIPSLIILESAKLLCEATSENELVNIFKALTNSSLINMGISLIAANLISSIKDPKLQNIATAIMQNEYLLSLNISFALANIIGGNYSDSNIQVITATTEDDLTFSRIILEIWQIFYEDPDQLKTVLGILSLVFGIDFTNLINIFSNYNPIDNLEALQRFVTNAQKKGLKRSLKRKPNAPSSDQFSIF